MKTLHIDKDTIGIYKRYVKRMDGSVIKGAAYEFANMFDLKIYTPRNISDTPPLLLNWGCSERPSINKGTTIINSPEAVNLAVSKILTVNILRDAFIPTISLTTMKELAQSWLNEDGILYNRELTRASGGRGIHIITNLEDVIDSQTYTRYYPSNREYRVHVFDGKVIDIQIKRKRSKGYLEDHNIKLDPYIKNLAGGYVFCRSGCRKNKDMMDTCIKAVQLLGLDFGAVDVLGNVENNTLVDFCILEINTAPGLEGSTKESYTNAILEFINKESNMYKHIPDKKELDTFKSKINLGLVDYE